MSQEIKIKLVSFGIAGDILGIRQMDYHVQSPATVASLKTQLIEKYSALSDLASIKFAVNGEYASDHQDLSEGCEVAIIPPVSGG